jgi:hypothetical protein
MAALLLLEDMADDEHLGVLVLGCTVAGRVRVEHQAKGLTGHKVGGGGYRCDGVEARDYAFPRPV